LRAASAATADPPWLKQASAVNLSRLFIERPIGTSLLSMGIFLFGMLAYFSLPVAPLPQLEFPVIFVSANQPGASPEVMAQTVAAPLERHFGQIPGVNEITSTSSLGSSVVIMQFDLSRDIDGAARDVQAAINAAQADLPAGLPSPPVYRKANPNDAPILILAITSDTLPLAQLFDLADTRVSPGVAQIAGVSEVQISGAAKPAVRIEADAGALASMGLSMDAVRNAVSGLTANAPKGAIAGDGQTWMISANDQLSSAADFQRTIIGKRDGTPIPLASVARVYSGPENAQQAAWANGERAILLFVRKQSTANVIETVDSIIGELPRFRALLPPAAKLSVISDRTQTIRASVNEVQHSLVISIVLVVLVMFLFLRRGVPTAIAGITVPVVLTATFGVMWLMKFSLDNLSLMALTVCVGFIVDDAIVVIENIVRHLERGEAPLTAALRGAREIGFTIVSMTVSLVAVFIPILFIGGIQGRLLNEFAVTLTAAIAVSGVISLMLTPSLCGLYLRADAPTRQPNRFERALEQGFDWMLGGYRIGLDWTLRHTIVMGFVTVATVVATIHLFIVIPKGSFPTQDTGVLFGNFVAAQDISFSAIAEKTERLAAVVLADPDVKTAAYSVGSNGRGNSNSGRMFITLRTREEGRKKTSDQIIERMRKPLAAVEGIQMYMQPVQDLRFGGRATRSQFLYALSATDLKDLYEWAPKVQDRLSALPQLKDVSSDLEQSALQLNVIVNRDAASRLGLTPQRIDAALYNAYGQRQIATLYDKSNQYRVVLEATPQERQDPSVLGQLNILTADGKAVPLSSIARFEVGPTSLSVNHQGQFTVVNLTFNLAPGVAYGDAVKLIDKELRAMQLPGSISGAYGGAAAQFSGSSNSMPLLILTALVVVYIVLGMLYESLIHPLTILSTLPSAGLGALLALRLANMELSIVAMIGIILLIGIVKKNAILLIDFALDAQRNRGLTPREAIYEACLTRFRPITMTTMAAVCGALPLAIGLGTGAELRQPLGVAIIGGLIVSQLLTLYTTPVFYLGFERLSGRRRKRLKSLNIAID
jgi:hydrophobe/amphiphile efflux-1 (HAE1) family protein